MSSAVIIPPARRPDLLLKPQDEGKVVVKDPVSGSYYDLGPEEAFLLEQLDGTRTADEVCAAFEARFGGTLSSADLVEFVELAGAWGLLRAPAAATTQAAEAAATTRPRSKQSLLAWRCRIFDPDRLFHLLEPHIRFFWTQTFVLFAAAWIVVAACMVWANRAELARPFVQGLRWETLALAWLTLFAVTTCHEFAHGLTCKHYGGEVHEVGFLLLFLIPGFYCNVSDSWLFPERSKRLGVTLAGGYFELFLWGMAVFVWRLTVPESLPNTLAWAVVSVSGVRVLFNFNPLMKLDGYYLLSDLVGVPNLRQRALASWQAHVRWVLWGGARPEASPHGRFLLAFGLASWVFSVTLLGTLAVGMTRFLVPKEGWVAVGATLLLGGLVMRGLFGGVFPGGANAMIMMRRRRAVAWCLGVGAVPALLTLGQVEDRSSGTFRVRPAARSELRAPISGFLRSVYQEEGERVSPGAPVLRLEVPDLETRIVQKRAELDRAQAELRQAEVGARPEEIAEQRARVVRARQWRARAERDLDRVRAAHDGRRKAAQEKIAQARAEHRNAEGAFRRARALYLRSFLSEDEYRVEEKQAKVAEAQLRQAEAELRALEAAGVIEAETELARREKDLADAQAELALLEAGSRPEELAAARARTAQLEEEAAYLEGLRDKLLVTTYVSGVVVTPRLREKVGQYFREGELIGEVQAASSLEIEIALDEQSAARVRVGQPVSLKARALAFRTITAHVDRIAPSAVHGEHRTTVTAYCRLDHPVPELRPEMTGYAHVFSGRRPVGEILAERVLGFLRTEFWI